jgi:ribosomal protein S18 acetylase RimI-like enzyme
VTDSGGPTDEITYRRAREEDAEQTYAVVQEAQGDLDRRAGREPHPALPAERIIRLRHFCVRNDGERFWVAEAGGQMVGAAYATLRDDTWYLDALHVIPAYQSRKVGSELIRRSMTGTGPTTALTVLTDASNPISNGLYIRFGMLPQDSTISFDGSIGDSGGTDGPLTSRAISAEHDAAALAAFDLATVGFARPTDHEFWLGVPNLAGRIVERDGSARGYVYVSAAGAIGPVAVADPRDLPAALDIAADIAAESGATTLHLRNFGSARGAIAWSVRRGLKVSGIGLMLSSRPVGRFAGYVTSGADALY